MEEELLIIVGRIKYNGATCDVRILFDSEIAGDIVIQNEKQNTKQRCHLLRAYYLL